MHIYNFRKDDFEDIETPINTGGHNDYALFKCRLHKRYGVYIFQTKSVDTSTRRTLYIGQGGVNSQSDSSRQILDRLKQQYQVKGEKLTGQTFYRNWLEKNEMCKSKETACRFLSQFSQWRLTTITTCQKSAIPLLSAVEAIFIHRLRPEYNKPYPKEDDIRDSGTLDQALCVTFESVATGFKFVVR